MAAEEAKSIPYPRRVFARALLRGLSRLIIRLLSRTEIHGLEEIPAEGPVILAANHVGTVEAVLMAAFPRRQVEFLGAGDLPFESGVNSITEAYGFIPVNRGNIDRKALKAGLDVLAQDGVIGIFPEGGTWEKTETHAHIGVAMLSQRSGAPVVPIGFSGMQGALSNVLRLKRPRFVMKLGKPIPALEPSANLSGARSEMQAYANLTLERIQSLLTPEERGTRITSSNYSLSLQPELVGLDLTSLGAQTFARMLFSDVILESFKLNLSMPVGVLYQGTEKKRSMSAVVKALDSIEAYLVRNQGFFTYRYGWDAGQALRAFMLELANALREANTAAEAVELRAGSRQGYQDGRVLEDQRHFILLPD